MKLRKSFLFLLASLFVMLNFLSPLNKPLTVYADEYSEGGTIEFGHWPYRLSENSDAVTALQGTDRGIHEFEGGYYYVTSQGRVSDTYPMTWKILNVGGDNLFLIQEYVYKGYNFDSDLSVDVTLTYENSDLRSYLNNTYIPYYFTQEEQSAMLALSGDKMFIPTKEDLESYLPSESDRTAHYRSDSVPDITTPMTGFGDAWAYDRSAETCAYWTSTIEEERIGAKQPTYVDCSGIFRSGGRVYYTWSVGVRPMMYINLSAIPCSHQYDDWSDVTPATCTEGGQQQHTCTKCGNVETRDVEALGHDWDEWITTKEATSTEKGLEQRTCKRCGEIETHETPMVGHIHDFGEWVITKEATVTETGEKKRTCKLCGDTETEIIPKSVTPAPEPQNGSYNDDNSNNNNDPEANIPTTSVEIIKEISVVEKAFTNANSQISAGQKTVVLDLGNYNSFQVSYLDKMAEHPDVTYIIKYKDSKGVEHSDRIPAGTDYAAIKQKLNGNIWLGPEFRKNNIDPKTADVDVIVYNRAYYPGYTTLNNVDGACYICSIAMVLSTMGYDKATPQDIYANNGRSNWIKASTFTNPLSYNTNLGHIDARSALEGKTPEEKKKQIIDICTQYPQGIMLLGPANTRNSSSHAVYAYLDNGVLKINDPYYPGLEGIEIGGANVPSQFSYRDYSTFQGYHIYYKTE